MQHRAGHRTAAPQTSLALIIITATGLTGCTPQSATNDRFDTWYQQMQTVLQDAHGIGGGGGATPGSVEVGMMRTGKWIVYAVCNNTDFLHIRIREAGRTEAETDLPCGATIAIPITVSTAGAHDFEIDTTHPKGTSGPGWWSAQVNSTSWHQTQTFSFN